MVVIVPILIYFLPNFEPFNKEKGFDKIGILLLTLICLSTMLCITQATSRKFNQPSDYYICTNNYHTDMELWLLQ